MWQLYKKVPFLVDLAISAGVANVPRQLNSLSRLSEGGGLTERHPTAHALWRMVCCNVLLCFCFHTVTIPRTSPRLALSFCPETLRGSPAH